MQCIMEKHVAFICFNLKGYISYVHQVALQWCEEHSVPSFVALGHFWTNFKDVLSFYSPLCAMKTQPVFTGSGSVQHRKLQTISFFPQSVSKFIIKYTLVIMFCNDTSIFIRKSYSIGLGFAWILLVEMYMMALHTE